MKATELRTKEDSPLNDEQLKAVEHKEGPLLVIAGAGTGKTSVITHRISRLIKDGINPSQILALTFTEKAATEMEERVDRLIPYGYSTVWLSTFHSFGDTLLRDNALTIGLPPDFKVLSESECIIFLREHLFRLPLNHYRPSGNPTRYLSALLRFIGRLKDEDVTPDEYIAFVERLKKTNANRDHMEEQAELSLTYKMYQELMAENGFIDFGDQVTLALKLLRAKPTVLERYQKRFSYILADEFQDTNYAQFELLKLMAGEKRNIMVVADDDQSIYKFRGAAVSNVMNFKRVYPDAQTVTLTKNHRSVQSILDASYRLIVHNNPDRLEVKEGIDKKLLSTRSFEGGWVRYLHFDSLTHEANWVVKTIEDKAKKKGRRLGDIAILVRANSDAEPFLRELSLRGIKHRFSGNRGLYSRDEINLLIRFLKAITDYTDTNSLFCLATSEIYGIRGEDLIPCHNVSTRTHRHLFNVMKDVAAGNLDLELSRDGKEGIKRLFRDVSRYSELALHETTGRVVYCFLKESGYISKLCSEPTEESEDKVRNIAKFFDYITHIENALPIKRAQAFTGYLTLLMDAGEDPPQAEPDYESDCVHVITVHKSKGLEFPVVFMVGLVSGGFPRTGKKELIEVPVELIKDTLPLGDFHLEEERRLFYVGMTRAMDELFLTSSSDYGLTRAKKISPFVVEAMDVPKAATVKTDPKEAIERYAPMPKRDGLAEAFSSDTVLHLSAYQVDDYFTCPLKYKYVHVLRIPLLPHHSIMFGKAIHEAISFYFSRRRDSLEIDEEEFLGVFKASWRSEGFISKAHEDERLEEGFRVLKRFFESCGFGIKPACVEREFFSDFGSFALKGRWDLIEERPDGPYIIDFKTSDVRDKEKACKKAKDSIQLRIYALSYKQNFGRLPAGLELRFVGSGITGLAVFDEKIMEKTVDDINRVSNGIRKRDFHATPGYLNCQWCAFGDICSERTE